MIKKTAARGKMTFHINCLVPSDKTQGHSFKTTLWVVIFCPSDEQKKKNFKVLLNAGERTAKQIFMPILLGVGM